MPGSRCVRSRPPAPGRAYGHTVSLSLPIRARQSAGRARALEAKPILNFALRSCILFNNDSGLGSWRMTQAQMTAYLADKIGISKGQAPSMLDELNELVTRQLKKEGSLRLAGLGVFRKRKTKARMGRNPATGAQIKIPARTRLRFTPAKALKDSVLGAR